MPIINWAYVAGFFDGEGSIRVGFKHGGATGYSAAINISQTKERGRETLNSISVFLSLYGIRSRVFSYKRGKANWSESHYLQICSALGVSKFIKLAFPYPHIKRVECQDILRFIRIYRGRTKERRAMSMKEAWVRRRVKC